jgi:hypothetical protein
MYLPRSSAIYFPKELFFFRFRPIQIPTAEYFSPNRIRVTMLRSAIDISLQIKYAAINFWAIRLRTNDKLCEMNVHWISQSL